MSSKPHKYTEQEKKEIIKELESKLKRDKRQGRKITAVQITEQLDRLRKELEK